MPSVLVSLCCYFASLKSEPTGIEFVDSTSIKVCHNLCIHRHKTLAGLVCRGKGIMVGSMALAAFDYESPRRNCRGQSDPCKCIRYKAFE